MWDFELELPQATDSPGSYVSHVAPQPGLQERSQPHKQTLVMEDPSLPDSKLYSEVNRNKTQGHEENGPSVKTTVAGACEASQAAFCVQSRNMTETERLMRAMRKD